MSIRKKIISTVMVAGVLTAGSIAGASPAMAGPFGDTYTPHRWHSICYYIPEACDPPVVIDDPWPPDCLVCGVFEIPRWDEVIIQPAQRFVR